VDGTITATVTGTDNNGEPVEIESSATMDTTPPTATVTKTNDGLVTEAEAADADGVVTVQAEAGSTSVVTFTGINGVVTKTVNNDGTLQPVKLTPTELESLGEGEVTVSTVTTDTAGNSSDPVDTDGFTIDTTAPTLEITTSISGVLANGAQPEITFTFSEKVAGFDASDLTVVGGTLGPLSTNDNGKTWKAIFTNDSVANTKPSITVDDNKYTDLAGNNGSGATLNWEPPVIKAFEVVDDFSVPGLNNNADSAFGVNSGNYDKPGTSYKYQGIVVNESATNDTQGLTNDRTPTINVTLDKRLGADSGQDLVVNRYIKDPIKGWVFQAEVAMTTSDYLTYTATDAQLPETFGQEYRYQMQIKANDSAGKSIVVSQQLATFTLDTKADALQAIEYKNGILSGANMEAGTVFADIGEGASKGNGRYDTGEPSGIVKSDGTWSINFSGLSANNRPSDNDTWDEANGRPFVNVYDEYVLLDFVDKAGNSRDKEQRFYLFDLDDNPTDKAKASLDRDDRPRDAQITMKDINSGAAWIDTDGDGTLNYALVWDHEKVGGAGDEGRVTESKETAASSDQIILVVGDVGGHYDKDSNKDPLAKDLFEIYTGGGNDSFSIIDGDMQVNTRINLGSGNDVFNLDGDMDGGTRTERHNAFSLRLDTGTGDDIANIGKNFKPKTTGTKKDLYVTDGVVITMGAGNDRLVFENGDLIDTLITMDQSFSKNLGSGDGAPAKPSENSTDGNDYLEVRGNIDNTTYIYMGGGNDIAVINDMKGSNSTTLLDMGSGDDLVRYAGNDITGKIDGGSGFDILSYDRKGSQTLYSDDFFNMERIDMVGTGRLYGDKLVIMDQRDIEKNGTVKKQLFVDGERGDYVEQYLANNEITQKDLFADSDGDSVIKGTNGIFTLDNGTGRKIKAVYDEPTKDTNFVYLDSDGNKTAENYEGNIYQVYTSDGGRGFQWLIDIDITVEGYTFTPII
jgi:hypothetical protein